MLLDAIKPCVIISEPTNPPMRFKWASSTNWEQGVVREKDVLFVCREAAIDKVSSIRKESLIVVITKPENAHKLPKASDLFLIIEDNEDSRGLLQKLQNYFLLIQSWRNEISAIPPSPDALRRVLNKSGKIIGAPLALYNDDLSPIAKTFFSTGSTLCREYENREKEILNNIRVIKKSPALFRGDKLDIIVESASIGDGKTPNFTLTAIFEHNPTPGQEDTFNMLVSFLAKRSDLRTGRFNPAKYSAVALFDDLINRRYISEGKLSDYASNIALPLDAEYRLFVFFDISQEDSNEESLLLSLRTINGGKNVVTTYDDNLCLLLYSKGLDNSLANNVVEEQLRPLISKKNGFVAVSQVFDDVTNTGLAYQQTRIVAKCKSLIDFEHWFTVSDQDKKQLCYTFEETLRFILVNPDELSPELKDFSFSHTILDKIIAEDAVNGGDDARILASYIHHERKATVVADKLHVHRNTVLYRISKIENRFGLNLNESWSRERLLFDFSILYARLMNKQDLFRRIVGCNFDELQLDDF